MFLSNNLFKISRVDGCRLKNVGELSFDFVDGACNSFSPRAFDPSLNLDPAYNYFLDHTDWDVDAWLCFDSSNGIEEAQKCYS